MSNTEINNLAKNRFINGSMQSEIFFRGNRTARGNLCRNPSLSNTVRDRLWKERGYVYKTEFWGEKLIVCSREGLQIITIEK